MTLPSSRTRVGDLIENSLGKRFFLPAVVRMTLLSFRVRPIGRREIPSFYVFGWRYFADARHDTRLSFRTHVRNLLFIVSWIEILRCFAPQNDITVISNESGRSYRKLISQEIFPSSGRLNDMRFAGGNPILSLGCEKDAERNAHKTDGRKQQNKKGAPLFFRRALCFRCLWQLLFDELQCLHVFMGDDAAYIRTCGEVGQRQFDIVVSGLLCKRCLVKSLTRKRYNIYFYR